MTGDLFPRAHWVFSNEFSTAVAAQAVCGCVCLMQTITAIEPQKKNPHRVNIYLDGDFAFGLASILAAFLKVGQQISPEKAASLQAEDEQEGTYQRALVFLSFRPRSTTEIRRNLEKHKVPEEQITATIGRLQQYGLVDDEKFARAWVENRNQFRPRSRSYLRMELRQKGINDDIIHAILEEDVDEADLALQAARKYSRRLKGMEWLPFRNKLAGFLARRGFSYGVYAPLLIRVWKECQEENAEGIENLD